MCFSRQCFFMLPPSCESLYLKECTQVWCNNGAWSRCSFSFIFCQRPWATHYLNIFFCFSWGFEIAAGWKEMKISGTSSKIVLTKPKKFASYSTSVIWSSSENIFKKLTDRIHKSWLRHPPVLGLSGRTICSLSRDQHFKVICSTGKPKSW